MRLKNAATDVTQDPNGVTEQINGGFTQVTPDQVDALLSRGFSYPAVETDPPCPVATANRGQITGGWPGYAAFDLTLGKPIWRNAANSGWVDATGSAV